MSTNTSVGRGPASGGNENHDGDPTSKTMGESALQEPPAGSGATQPQAPAESMPGGPNVGPSPWEVDAARGKLPPK